MRSEMSQSEKDLLKFLRENGEVRTNNVPDQLLQSLDKSSLYAVKKRLKKRGYIEDKRMLQDPRHRVWLLTNEGGEADI